LFRGNRRQARWDLQHKAILQIGDAFPACRICGTAVRFDFAQLLTESDEIEHIGYDLDFIESVLICEQSEIWDHPASFP
jgi:hypothetical protein